MKAHRVERGRLDASRMAGMILCEELRDEQGRSAFRKGQALGTADLALLERLPWRELHVIEPERGDLHEEDAGRRIAAAAAGDGAGVQGFAGGHWAIAATRRGLLEVSIEALHHANRVEGACIYTLFDGQVVDEREVIARAKITPFVLPEERVREVERLARDAAGLVRVLAFHPTSVGAVVQETVSERGLARFRGALGEKLEWFGSDFTGAVAVRPDPGAVAEAVRELVRNGARIVVLAGTKAMDPLDPAFVALGELGASLERYGVPAHPGSLFWMATMGDVPLLGMPTCGLFAKATAFDLIIPRLLAGQRVDHDSLAALGHGGLLTTDTSFRFPPYRRAGGRGEVDEA